MTKTKNIFLLTVCVAYIGLLCGCQLFQQGLSDSIGINSGTITGQEPEKSDMPPSCIPEIEPEVAQVTEVIDGDTIKVSMGDEIYTVRYIGIDTPETVAPNTEVQPYGPEASLANKKLVEGKTVSMWMDTSNTDRYDRLLRYVMVDGKFVNYELVLAGYAYAKEYPPDTACSKIFEAAQSQASKDKTGLWGLNSQISANTTPDPWLPSSTGLCPAGCETEKDGCSIKGNINSSGEKIYHLPGGEHYSTTKINPGAGEKWFCSIEEAVSNGWRALKD